MGGQGMQTIRLARGARHLVPVTPGARILVRHGSVRLRPPPEWPADTFAHPAWRLDAEDSYEATARGYAELAAAEAAEVLLIPAVSVPERAAVALAGLWRAVWRALAATGFRRAP